MPHQKMVTYDGYIKTNKGILITHHIPPDKFLQFWYLTIDIISMQPVMAKIQDCIN